MSKTLPPLYPNEGLRVIYQRRLERIVDDMAADVTHTMTQTYADEPPATVALDASSTAVLQAAMQRLSLKWGRRFDKLSRQLAAYFAKDAADRVDQTLKKQMRDAGFTVKFRPSPAIRDALQSTVAENVSLIRSIPEQYLKAVEGDVMRSVQVGRDLHSLSEALQKSHGVTKRRAALIARDQNNKATATIARLRQQEIGVTRAKWMHSRGGKHPRPEHVAFSGQPYDVSKGAFLEGKWTWPGVEINCRCYSRAIIPGVTKGY